VLALLLLFAGVVYYYYVPDIPVEELNVKYQVPAANYIAVDGMNVHFREEGMQADSVPLVLLHGTGSSLYTWNGWTDILKKNHKIVRLDLPGFGLTGPHPTDDYTLEVYINFIHSFLAKRGIERCILAGNSLGGEIAWRYALTYPSQIKKLVLVDAAGYPTAVTKVPLSYILLRIPLIRDLLVKSTPPSVIGKSLEFLYAEDAKVSSQLVELYFDMTCREGNRQALTERMESIAQDAPVAQLPTLTIPTLIIWGAQDRLIPVEHARQFQQDLPNSTLAIFPDAGHMPMEEIPEKTAVAFEQFLKESTYEDNKILTSR
jgi:pimeloyl-ACP methyl ester carboxylesterase